MQLDWIRRIETTLIGLEGSPAFVWVSICVCKVSDYAPVHIRYLFGSTAVGLRSTLLVSASLHTAVIGSGTNSKRIRTICRIRLYRPKAAISCQERQRFNYVGCRALLT